MLWESCSCQVIRTVWSFTWLSKSDAAYHLSQLVGRRRHTINSLQIFRQVNSQQHLTNYLFHIFELSLHRVTWPVSRYFNCNRGYCSIITLSNMFNCVNTRNHNYLHEDSHGDDSMLCTPPNAIFIVWHDKLVVKAHEVNYGFNFRTYLIIRNNCRSHLLPCNTHGTLLSSCLTFLEIFHPLSIF